MRIDDFLSKDSSGQNSLAKEQQKLLQELMAAIHFLNAHYLDEFPTPEDKLKALNGNREKLQEWSIKNKHITVVEDEGHKVLGKLIDNELLELVPLSKNFFTSLDNLSNDKTLGHRISKITNQLHRLIHQVKVSCTA